MPSFADELSQMAGDIEDVLATATIALVNPGAATIDTVTGARTEPSSQTQSVSANRMPVSRDAAKSADGRSRAEHRKYGVRAASVTIGTPGETWRIVDGGVTLEVVSAERDAESLMYVISAAVRG